MSPVLRAVAPPLVLLAGVAGYLVLIMPRAAEMRPDPEEVAPLVETTEMAVHGNGLDINVDGVVVPYREIAMAAEVAGRVTMKADVARAGNYVAKGTVLLEIDPRDYALAVHQLQRELEQAEATLKELDVEVENFLVIRRLAEEQLNLHTVEYERQQKLAERRVVTATQLDQAQQSVLQSQGQLMELRKQIQMLETRRTRLESVKNATDLRLEKAKLDLERTQVAAPSNGVIVRDRVEKDSFVNKGTELFVFEDTSSVEVRCNLLMDDLYWLWLQRANGSKSADTAAEMSALDSKYDYQAPRTPATIIYELAGQKYAWRGELSRFDGIGLDDATRMVPCRISVAHPREVRLLNPGGPGKPPSGPPALVRGMFVGVRIHAQPDTELLRVPEDAIRPGNRLWLARDGKLRIVEVRVVQRQDGFAIVRPKAGGNGASHRLAAGTRVVTSPLAVAEDGMALRESRP